MNALSDHKVDNIIRQRIRVIGMPHAKFRTVEGKVLLTFHVVLCVFMWGLVFNKVLGELRSTS